MKKLITLLSFLAVMLALLASCSPAPASPAGETPVGAGPESSATSTLEPISFSGPEMKVGSTWLYVDGSVLVAVPAGEFTMGYGGPDSPQHQVSLPDFWIFRSKVTNQQYAACVKAGQCSVPNKGDSPGYGDPLKANDPVTGVDYEQSV